MVRKYDSAECCTYVLSFILSPSDILSIEANYSKLEVDLHAVERREQELITAKLNLEDQLDSVIRQSHEALNDTQIELNKSKLHGQTLERKYEVCVSEYLHHTNNYHCITK